MPERVRQLGATALALLLLVSAVTAPVSASAIGSTAAIDSPDGVAPATSTDSTCSALSAAATHATSAISTVIGLESASAACDAVFGASTASEVENVRDAKTNQTKIDIALAANAQRAQFESYQTVTNNYLNDSRSAAWMAAEVAVANAYANNSTKTEARAAAREAIKDYWSVKQYNLIQSYNTQTQTFYTLHDRAANESGIVAQDFVTVGVNARGYTDFDLENRRISNVTLANGTQASVREPLVVGPEVNSGSNDYHVWVSINQTKVKDSGGVRGELKIGNDSDGYAANYKNLHVKNTSQTPKTVLVPWRWYKATYDRTWALQRQQINTSYDWIDGMWPALENGTITSSEITSRTTDLYRTSPSDGSVNLYDAVAALSGMGLAAPNMDGLGTMEVVHNNTTDYGLLLADRAPGGAWQANTTYAVGGSTESGIVNVSAPVYLATTDGRQIALEGQFRVGNITTVGGSSVSNVSATKVVYQTSNTTEYIEKMERLLNQSMAINARLSGSAGGGSSSGGLDPKMVGVVLLIGVGAYAASRHNGGDGRNRRR